MLDSVLYNLVELLISRVKNILLDIYINNIVLIFAPVHTEKERKSVPGYCTIKLLISSCTAL